MVFNNDEEVSGLEEQLVDRNINQGMHNQHPQYVDIQPNKQRSLNHHGFPTYGYPFMRLLEHKEEKYIW